MRHFVLDLESQNLETTSDKRHLGLVPQPYSAFPRQVYILVCGFGKVWKRLSWHHLSFL